MWLHWKDGSWGTASSSFFLAVTAKAATMQLWAPEWTALLHVEQMLYSKVFFSLFFQWCFLCQSHQNNSSSRPICILDSFSLHSKSECSPETATADALKAGQAHWMVLPIFLLAGIPVCKRSLLSTLQRCQTTAGPQYKLSFDNTKCSRCINKPSFRQHFNKSNSCPNQAE